MSPESAASGPRPAALYVSAALSGAAVMIVELTATRLFAPWFGASIYAWTNVVAVVLTALAAGYYVGGRAADLRPSARVLSRAMLAAAALVAAAAFGGPHLAAALAPDASGDPGAHLGALVLGSLLAGAIAFGPPLFLLGWTSPFVARLLGDAGVPAGQAAGRALAVSTAGSLLGTYLPAFLLLEHVGSRGAVLTAAGFLVVAAGILTGPRGARSLGGAAAIVAGFSAATAATPFVPAGDGAPVDFAAESAYQYVQTSEVVGRGGKRYLHLSLDEGRGEFHSRKALDGSAVTDAYYDLLAVVPDWIAEADARPLEVLVIGGGAGTLRGLLRRFHPSRVARVDDVELDPLVAGLSARFGGAPQAPDRVFVADGRAVLRSEGARYDFIVLDAYARQLAVPAHLGSREAFAEAAARLTPRGVFAMNVSAAEVRSPLVQTLVRTMREAFPEVRAVPVAGSWNLLLLAGAELDVRRAVAARGDALDAARREFRRALRTLPAPDPEWRPLTDDLAPLESLARRIK